MNCIIRNKNISFTIRSATNNDTGQIIKLVKEVLPEFNLLYSPVSSEKDLLDIENAYINNGGAFEVIENDKCEIIGTAALLKMNDKTAKLRKMYLAKSYRGLGLGKMLIERMIYKAIEFQFDEIILETVESMKEAIRLYEKYEFRKTEYKTIDSPRCDIVMRKKLNLTN